MKVAILGCSHSAGLVLKDEVDMEKGWVPMLGKMYPEHEFHVYATSGHGYNNIQQGIRAAYLQKCDMVIIQNTTPREFVPVCDIESWPEDHQIFKPLTLRQTPNVHRYYKNQHAINVKHSYSTEQTERFHFKHGDVYYPKRRYSATFRSCTKLCNEDLPHWDNLEAFELIHKNDMVIDKEQIWHLKVPLKYFKREYEGCTSYNTNMIGHALTFDKGGMFGNQRFKDMYMSQLKQKNLLKKIFKHVYHLSFVSWQSAADDFDPDIKYQQKYHWDEMFDWKPDVVSWLHEFISNKMNVSMQNAHYIFRDVWNNHRGHLDENFYQYFIHNYLLSNEEFANVLES